MPTELLGAKDINGRSLAYLIRDGLPAVFLLPPQYTLTLSEPGHFAIQREGEKPKGGYYHVFTGTYSDFENAIDAVWLDMNPLFVKYHVDPLVDFPVESCAANLVHEASERQVPFLYITSDSHLLEQRAYSIRSENPSALLRGVDGTDIPDRDHVEYILARIEREDREGR